ncbi:unnamed protein product [Ectocarpus fasciculatus]
MKIRRCACVCVCVFTFGSIDRADRLTNKIYVSLLHCTVGDKKRRHEISDQRVCTADKGVGRRSWTTAMSCFSSTRRTLNTIPSGRQRCVCACGVVLLAAFPPPRRPSSSQPLLGAAAERVQDSRPAGTDIARVDVLTCAASELGRREGLAVFMAPPGATARSCIAAPAAFAPAWCFVLFADGREQAKTRADRSAHVCSVLWLWVCGAPAWYCEVTVILVRDVS